jgi:thiamine-monophosphate kinase
MTGHNRPNDEFKLIRQVTAMMKRTRSDQTLVSFGDDAAVYRPSKEQGQVVTVDTLVEGIHFTRRTMSPFQIGHKALAANLSDIAAMGGVPTYFLISLAVSPDWTEQELKEIYAGMSRLAERYHVDLLGGDTVFSPHQLMISITALGEVNEATLLLRSQAKVGHKVFVTGALGLAAAGLDILLQGSPLDVDQSLFFPLLKAHQEPEPHVQQGQIIARLAQNEAVALNDVSDGLASEANEIAQASGTDLVLEKEKLPVQEELLRYARKRGKDPYEWILKGGEDFVLVGTAGPDLFAVLSKTFSHHGLSLYDIGRVEPGEGRVWLEDNGKKVRLEPVGYNHFQKWGH